MNVCAVCMADGVLEVNGSWYCIDHMESGLEDVARVMAQLCRNTKDIQGDELFEAFQEVLAENDYYPDDNDDD